MKRKWTQRLIIPALVSCIAAVWLSFPGKATEMIDSDRKCSLTVVPGSFTGDYLSEDIMKANIVIDLYQVAAVDEKAADGFAYGGAVFKLLEPYGGKETGLQITEGMSKDDWRRQTQNAARIVFGITGEGEFGGTVLEPVRTGVPMARDGSVISGSIGDLDAGLYLLVARWGGTEEDIDYTDVEKYVVTAEDGEEGYRVASIANSNACVYTFEPELISLPGRDPYTDAGGNAVEGGAAGPGGWLYDISVVLKAEVDFRYGGLQINKNLTEYETSGPVTFVFEVTASWRDYVNGDGAEREYRDVVAMDFTKAESQFKLIENLPVGAVVTVKEVYSGSSYRPEREDGEDPFVQTTVIDRAEQIFEVSFTNRYDRRRVGGHGITNHFAYDEEEGRWIWNSVRADGSLGGEAVRDGATP